MDSLTPTFVGKVDTFYATIHMAGDVDHARQIIRIFVLEGPASNYNHVNIFIPEDLNLVLRQEY